MKILVTGATGFVGKHLLAKLKGHEILAIRNTSEIGNFRPDYVFSLAGEIYDHDTMYQANVQLPYDLLMATKNIPYQAFIHVGSSSEYGRKTGPIKETDSLHPVTWYETTKCSGSLMCQELAKEFDKPIVVVRPFSLYGSGDKEHKLIPTLLRAARSDRKIKISDAVHDYVYIDDFIDGLMLLTQGADVVNFGSGVQYSNEEVAKLLGKVMSIEFLIEKVSPLRCYDSMNWACDPSYAWEKYGWKAFTTLEDGLRKIAS